MQGLTKRQLEIIEYISSFYSQHNYSPSYREIQEYFGFSSLGSVYNHIQSLKKKGALEEKGQSARSLKLCQHKPEGSEIPLIGMLRGGRPIETYALVSMIPLPSQMIPTEKECYLLRIVGSELEEELLKGGDLLLVQPRSSFANSEMILAQVDRKITLVKRGFHAPPYLRLESENPDVQPVILRETHVEVLGVVISLIRDYSSSS